MPPTILNTSQDEDGFIRSQSFTWAFFRTYSIEPRNAAMRRPGRTAQRGCRLRRGMRFHAAMVTGCGADVDKETASAIRKAWLR